MSFIAVGGTLLAGSAVTAGTIAAGAGLAGTAASIYGQHQAAKAAQGAVDSQRGIVNNYLRDLKYEPIDIEKVKRDATAQAIQNATGALALERQLQPDVAATRAELARQVNSDLAQRGNLPPDIANKVALEARVAGGRSGTQDNLASPTAAMIGLTSLDLLNRRQAAASNLLSANPLQATGLDPGSTAAVEVAQNAAMNQFNIDKAGATAGAELGLTDAQAKARGAEIGGQTSLISGIAGGVGTLANLFNTKPTTTTPYTVPDYLKKTGPSFSAVPRYNPVR